MKKATKRTMLQGTALLIGLLFIVLLLHNQALAFSFANYLSIKIIERAPDTRLVIGREGVANPSLNVVMGPRVVTLAPTDVISAEGQTRATLRGELTDLNIDQSVTIWFEWGYSRALGNIVGEQTVSTTGTYSYTLTNFRPGPIFYRFVAKGGDGTNPGNHVRFALAEPQWTIINVIPIAVLLTILVGLFTVGLKDRRLSTFFMLIAMTIMGIIVFTIVRQIIDVAFFGG